MLPCRGATSGQRPKLKKMLGGRHPEGKASLYGTRRPVSEDPSRRTEGPVLGPLPVRDPCESVDPGGLVDAPCGASGAQLGFDDSDASVASERFEHDECWMDGM